MKHKNQFYFLLTLLLLFPNYALAYLDPVSGLVIFQAIVAFIATVYATIILKPIRFFKRIFSKKDKKQSEFEDKVNKEIDKNKD